MTLKCRMWQGFRYLCAISIILIGLLSIIATGGGSGGGNGDDSNVSLFPDSQTEVPDVTAISEIYFEDEEGEEINVEVADRHVLAYFEDDSTRADYDEFLDYLEENNYTVIGQIPSLNMLMIKVGSSQDILPASSRFSELPYIEIAMSDPIIRNAVNRTESIYPDPDEWNGDNWVENINADKAWQLTTGDNNIKIGIVDGGFYTPTYSNYDEKYDEFKNRAKYLNTASYNPEMTSNVHGYQVASVAAASGYNGIGMAGVCWDCKLLTHDVTNPWFIPGDSTVSSIISGIENCLNEGAKVINLSLSGLDTKFHYRIYRWHIAKTMRLFKNNKSLLVIAQGNLKTDDDNDLFPPYIFGNKKNEYESLWKEHAIIVTASDRNNQIYYNAGAYGAITDIAAPGDYVSAYYPVPNGVVQYVAEGTSYSAPLVSGAAALLFSQNPNLHPIGVKSILIDNAQQSDVPGIGILDVHAALLDERVKPEDTQDGEDATMSDFVGTWAGNIEFTSDTESFTEPITLNVSIEGNNVVGMVVFGDGDSDLLTGTVSNGMWHFNIISSDPSDPDCANWDVSGISELFDDFNEMEIFISGTFCGAGGGQQGSVVGTLNRQSGSGDGETLYGTWIQILKNGQPLTAADSISKITFNSDGTLQYREDDYCEEYGKHYWCSYEETYTYTSNSITSHTIYSDGNHEFCFDDDDVGTHTYYYTLNGDRFTVYLPGQNITFKRQ